MYCSSPEKTFLMRAILPDSAFWVSRSMFCHFSARKYNGKVSIFIERLTPNNEITGLLKSLDMNK
jgi:hypothetical protein